MTERLGGICYSVSCFPCGQTDQSQVFLRPLTPRMQCGEEHDRQDMRVQPGDRDARQPRVGGRGEGGAWPRRLTFGKGAEDHVHASAPHCQLVTSPGQDTGLRSTSRLHTTHVCDGGGQTVAPSSSSTSELWGRVHLCHGNPRRARVTELL